jgi:hypothetical protein
VKYNSSKNTLRLASSCRRLCLQKEYISSLEEGCIPTGVVAVNESVVKESSVMESSVKVSCDCTFSTSKTYLHSQ